MPKRLPICDKNWSRNRFWGFLTTSWFLLGDWKPQDRYLSSNCIDLEPQLSRFRSSRCLLVTRKRESDVHTRIYIYIQQHITTSSWSYSKWTQHQWTEAPLFGIHTFIHTYYILLCRVVQNSIRGIKLPPYSNVRNSDSTSDACIPAASGLSAWSVAAMQVWRQSLGKYQVRAKRGQRA